MKKDITKRQVVETALELLKNENHLQELNLRKIARALGCAHTNLYNYFSSYSELLWETHAVLHEVFMERLAARLSTVQTAEMGLTCFFEAFVDIYLENKGWFQLAWQDYIEGERPQRDIEILQAASQMLNEQIYRIWTDYSGTFPGSDQIKLVLHNTHCYIVGEISNYILGRGLIDKEEELKPYIVRTAVQIFKLCLLDSSRP